MKSIKRFLNAAVLVVASTVGTSAHAGIPVIDAAAITQAVEQVIAWGKQYQQMVDQLQQAKAQFDSMNGVRNMGSLVNNASARQYLPADYQTILSNGVGQWQAIYNAAKTFDMSTSQLAATGEAAQAFSAIARQAAINRATAEEAYKTSSQRFTDIQILLEKVNDAPDAKDIADLQARIQAEQVMMQNEANKLQSLSLVMAGQRDLAMQQAAERRMKSTRGTKINW